MTAARHRAPAPPPLLARLNQPAPLRVAVIAGGVVVLVVCSLVMIAEDVGDRITPVAHATVTPRVPEPTGRGGPLAPVMPAVDAPHYPIGNDEPFHTPEVLRTVTPDRPVIATSAALPIPGPVLGPLTPAAPVVAEGEALAPPAEPEPVVGLPVVEPVPVTEEEVVIVETPPDVVVVEPTETPVTEPPLAEEAS